MLPCPELRINASLFQQRFMPASLHNATFFQDQYLIRIPDRGQTVGNGQGGTLAGRLLGQRIHDGLFEGCTE